MKTHGQIVGGKTLSYGEFLKAVKTNLERAIGKNTITPKIIKKLYDKGYSIEDAISFLILN